jgi:uncharacterized caspase-like protein
MKQVLAGFFMVLLIGGCTDNPPVPDEPTKPIQKSPPTVECNKCVTLGNRASPKKALVIGNSQYAHKPLINPQNDATDMAKLLAEEMGYHVIRAVDLSYKEMQQVISDFHQLVANTPADVDDKVGLFYFSGHGARSNRDENYLLPTDNGKIRTDYDLRRKAFQVKSDIVEPLETDNNGANIIIADACRDNPYEGSAKSNKRGLIPISPSPAQPQKGGALIAFAASEGQLSDDGTGRNGLYTEHLLVKMRELKNDAVERIFKQVADPVKKKSRGNQTPEYASSLTKKYCLKECQ